MLAQLRRRALGIQLRQLQRPLHGHSLRRIAQPVAAGLILQHPLNAEHPGAILALPDRTDRWHAACMNTFRVLRLVGDSRHEVEIAWQFIRSGAIRIAVIEDTELPEIQALMSRYWDRPMDFADATLVYLARREGLSTIVTVDHY